MSNFKSKAMSAFEYSSSKESFWNIDLPESPWDVDGDTENLDVLCELVRKQYLKRLRQTLFDNLDVTKGYQKEHIFRVEQCVDICVAEMEKQALRRCMMASIYRESMSSIINKVKSSTKNAMLYAFLQHIIESNKQLSTSNLGDKYLGKENMKKNSVSIGINTETKLNKIASAQTEKLTDSDINSSNHLFVSNKTDLMNKSNSPSSSFDMKSKNSVSNIFDNLNSLLKSSSHSPSTCSDVPINYPNPVNFIDDSSEFENIQGNSEKKNCTENDILSINSLLRDLQDSPEYEQQSLKLEERLIALGKAIENQESTKNVPELTSSIYISPNTMRLNKINETLKDKYKSERVAKAYELRKSLNELSHELQKRLNQKYNDLFGTNHSYESDPLSDEEERIIAHKRVVKMVVQCMTPYYKAHRINRYLFKSLAKLISKNLMDRNYDPDEKTVARSVGEFFTGNRCIKTAEDIYSL